MIKMTLVSKMRKLAKNFQELKEKYYKTFRWIFLPIKILIAIAVIRGLFWLGFKGLIGLLAGMFFMTHVFMSKNPMVSWLVNRFRIGEYIEEIEGNQEKEAWLIKRKKKRC